MGFGDDGHTSMDIAKYLGVTRATLYRCLSEDGAADRQELVVGQPCIGRDSSQLIPPGAVPDWLAAPARPYP